MAKGPGLVDVARAAGVSHMTVSRVLNGHPMVKDETRQRVLAAVQELGYRRNSIARALHGDVSGTLGVVLAGEELFELPKVLLGIETAAKDAGYWVNLAAWHGGSADDLTETVNRLIDQSVDGIAFVADRPLAAEALSSVNSRVPVAVVMSGAVANEKLASVEIDQVAGARAVTRHLLDLGHRRLVHLSGPERVYDAHARVVGFREEMRAAGEQARVLEGDLTPDSGYTLMRQLLGGQASSSVRAGEALPTAVFAGNDMMAMGALKALTEAGLRVPDDVSLVGFDDSPGMTHLVPPLTTVRQNFTLLGATVIDLVLTMLAGAAPVHRLIPPELIVRASTQPLQPTARS
ncbi:LacI family transcriptional regulator [Kineococcus radiotolerans]|uniref:LacI family transcriptional regulator n=1 Tax=Kineococcus radiotolerans TaxID=131568 RepID=A0A7W4TR33_KINRA|nr:LacI family DNA-binding transcriptional regulator [Kineococcus radiotolerans]MBB2903385.1 LacI family transcriptional regulator [Kineococcus radiotolerans]